MISRLILIMCIVAAHAASQSVPKQPTAQTIGKYAASVDSAMQKDTTRFHFCAKVTSKQSLVRVRSRRDWPEETEVSYCAFFDRAGHLVYFCQSPVSESGDWHMLCEHYFNADGAVLLMSYSVSGFNSECVDVMRQETRLFFDTNFNLIGKESSLTDQESRPISGEGCEFNYKFPFTVYPEVRDIPESIRKALRVPE